jgi:nucleoid-associated protein YgaU
MGLISFKKNHAMPVQQEKPKEYVIQSGDSLPGLARRQYGKVTEWRRIYEANKDVISDPDFIQPGCRIIIPR